MVQFGTQFTKEEAERASGGSSSNRWIKYFRKPVTTVRFLEEMEQTDGVPSPWTAYWEHYNQAKQKSYPCLGDKNLCPGCQNQDRSSKRYLVNMLVDGYVDLWKIPTSLINSLQIKAERDGGTIRARDYTIYRTGSGKDVEYTVESEDKERVDLSAYADQLQDHQEALREAFVEAWGKSPEEFLLGQAGEETQERPATRPAQVQREEPRSSMDALRASAAAARKATEVPTPDPEEEVIDEETILAMNTDQLLDLYVRCGVTPPDSDNAEVLAKYLIDTLGE